jgi:hypothetical protein
MIGRPKVLSSRESGVRRRQRGVGSGNGIDEIQDRRRTPHAAREPQAARNAIFALSGLGARKGQGRGPRPLAWAEVDRPCGDRLA